MTYQKRVIACAVLTAGLYGCSDTSSYDFENSLATAQQDLAQTAAAAAPVASFDPANGDVPFPNSILFIDPATGGPSADGTLSIAVADPEDLTDVQVSLNALDGFSTSSAITMSVGASIDPATVCLLYTSPSPRDS